MFHSGLIHSSNLPFFRKAYAIIQLISTIRVGQLIYSKSSPLSRPQALKARSQIRYTYNLGSVIFLTGFAIWNLDNIYCSDLRRWREKVGYPLGFLLEGHAVSRLGTSRNERRTNVGLIFDFFPILTPPIT